MDSDLYVVFSLIFVYLFQFMMPCVHIFFSSNICVTNVFGLGTCIPCSSSILHIR